ERGLEPFDAQDRMIRGSEASPPSVEVERALRVEPVVSETADEWAEFIQRVYRLDTGPWLQRLVGRSGWHPYVVREEGTIVAARTMFIGGDGFAWWGMDGPVPGLMTDDYEPDAALCEFMVRDGLEMGVRCFLADIEVPSDAMDTPAYEYFGRLGFRRPYVRTHYARLCGGSSGPTPSLTGSWPLLATGPLPRRSGSSPAIPARSAGCRSG